MTCGTTSATRLLDGGLSAGAVSERLGHGNATTSLAIYAHAVPATDRLAAEMMAALLDGPVDRPARGDADPVPDSA